MICKRFALVGSGFIGQVHAASLARHEGSALTMVADAAPERAQALAARYGARAVTVSEAISALSRACGRTGSAGYRDLITSILTPLFAP